MSIQGEILEGLILDGSVEIAGLSEEGEFMYRFTPSMRTNHPEFFEYLLDMSRQAITHLWEKGFLEIDMTEEDPYVYLNRDAITPEILDQLSDAERMLVEGIMQYYESDE